MEDIMSEVEKIKKSKKLKESEEEKQQREKRNKEWIELCEYVKLEVLQYSPYLKFPKMLALRLKGLMSGTFMANKKQKPEASYTIEQLFMTFKVYKNNIINGLAQANIKDEKHRINYMMVIIEANINDVVMRMKQVVKTNEKASNVKIDGMEGCGVEYKDRMKDSKEEEEKKRIAKKLEDLW
jgi:hypothetical protein